ncbi:cell surface protein [Lactobacillus pentosus]|uniref:cell surface protein n=1 Tax=Lactiplantibacillus pentosus TaxID=1589 RepID=UPI00128CA161|nr:cell surface protein [Lactiplantibacillus pentosus]MCH4129068.1 cell surface protein [Lactiplantibacillus sp.]MPQ19360.1 cell surface protein [Lactiplantibacillus pentosus]UXI96880.1 cell surface protein [Lactiplantibacillus pentosus]BBM22375.1 cell surface protein [Lactiplantibacillus plantarum]
MWRRRLMGIGLGLLVWLWLGPAVLATAQPLGTTETQISFYAGSKSTTPTATGEIPQGDMVYQTRRVLTHEADFAGQLQRTLATGQLPQTGESLRRYQQLFGVLTLVALGLIWQISRTLRGGDTRATLSKNH